MHLNFSSMRAHIWLKRVWLKVTLPILFVNLPGRQVQLIKLVLLKHEFWHLYSLDVFLNILLQIQFLTLLHKVQRVSNMLESLQLRTSTFLVEWRHGGVLIKECRLVLSQLNFTHILIEELIWKVHIRVMRLFGMIAVLLKELRWRIFLLKVGLITFPFWISK